MALSARRWLALALLGCAAIAVIYWPGGPAEEDASRDTQLARPHRALQYRTSLEGALGRSVVLLQLRDRILTALANQPDDAGPVEFRFPPPRPVPAARLAAATTGVTRLLRPAHPLIRTVVVPLPDTTYELPSGSRVSLLGTWYIMPAATNGRVCLALPRRYDLGRLVNFLLDTAATPSEDVGARLLVTLGPCAFYTAFGAPGPGIEQWLRAQQYATASNAHWTDPRARVTGPERGDLERLNWTSVWDMLRQGSSGAFEMGNLNLQARACAHGTTSQCRDLWRSPFGDARQILRGHAVARHWTWAREDLGASFLSELVRLEGRDAFARFWQSSLPVDSAFQRAFGAAMEQWTSRWLLSAIERPRFGPVIRFGSLVFGLVLVAAAVGAAGVLSARRQVS